MCVSADTDLFVLCGEAAASASSATNAAILSGGAAGTALAGISGEATGGDLAGFTHTIALR